MSHRHERENVPVQKSRLYSGALAIEASDCLLSLAIIARTVATRILFEQRILASALTDVAHDTGRAPAFSAFLRIFSQRSSLTLLLCPCHEPDAAADAKQSGRHCDNRVLLEHFRRARRSPRSSRVLRAQQRRQAHERHLVFHFRSPALGPALCPSGRPCSSAGDCLPWFFPGVEARGCGIHVTGRTRGQKEAVCGKEAITWRDLNGFTRQLRLPLDLAVRRG